MSNESFETATLADLYARQGHYDRARAIYERLTRECPEDHALAARFQAMLALALGSERDSAGATRDRRLATLQRLLTRVRNRRRS